VIRQVKILQQEKKTTRVYETTNSAIKLLYFFGTFKFWNYEPFTLAKKGKLFSLVDQA